MKRLIVCCDGTWNDIDKQSRETNVFRIAKAIHGSQDTGGVLQIVLYLRGIGTSGLKAEIWIEGATGLGVDDNIRSGATTLYTPKNLVPLFNKSGKLKPKVSTVD